MPNSPFDLILKKFQHNASLAIAFFSEVLYNNKYITFGYRTVIIFYHSL